MSSHHQLFFFWSRAHGNAVATSLRTKNRLTGKYREPLFTMATGTLRAITSRNKVPITLFLLLCMDYTSCQQFVFPFKAPSDCSVEEFFDISSLSCVKCGPNQRRSTTGQYTEVATACDVIFRLSHRHKIMASFSFFFLKKKKFNGVVVTHTWCSRDILR